MLLQVWLPEGLQIPQRANAVTLQLVLNWILPRTALPTPNHPKPLQTPLKTSRGLVLGVFWEGLGGFGGRFGGVFGGLCIAFLERGFEPDPALHFPPPPPWPRLGEPKSVEK